MHFCCFFALGLFFRSQAPYRQKIYGAGRKMTATSANNELPHPAQKAEWSTTGSQSSIIIAPRTFLKLTDSKLAKHFICER